MFNSESGGQRKGGGPDIPAQESRHAEKGGIHGMGPLSGRDRSLKGDWKWSMVNSG